MRLQTLLTQLTQLKRQTVETPMVPMVPMQGTLETTAQHKSRLARAPWPACSRRRG